jgi:perosamine synthetase
MAVTDALIDLVVEQSTSLRDALAPLDRSGLGFLMIVDAGGVLVGVLTDGDIRRAMLRGQMPDEPVRLAMRTDFVSLPVEADTAQINHALTDRIAFVPLIDAAGRPADFASHARHRRFPVAEPLLDGNEAEYLLECVRTGWISSQGSFVRAFERAIADFHDMPFAVAVSNGTAALHLALLSVGVAPGDEVIVPDFTFAATASAVIHAGATPVFVDVDPTTWTIDAGAVADAVTERTTAIVPVHIYGHPCDMPPLVELARDRGLRIVEDNAEALGARAHGQLTGTFGDVACFSFYGNKTLTTGEGGMILFKDEAAAARASRLRDHGMSPDRRYWHLEAGFNYRLTNLQAAVGVAQMERIDEILQRKRTLAERYAAHMSGVEGISLPPHAAWADPVCWLYTVRVGEELGLTRDELASRLLVNGIETRPVFEPLHLMPPFERFARGGAFPATDAIAATGLSLPSAVTLREEDVDDIAESIQAIVRVRRLHAAAGGAA